MQTFFTYLLFVIGLMLIIKGADWLVDAARFFARRFGVSELVIGVTIVSVCTTLPEATVSLMSAAIGESAMALSNAFGSIAANIGLILAAMFLLARPEIKDKRTTVFNAGILLIALLFVGVNLGMFQGVPQASGFVLLALLVCFLMTNARNAKKHPSPKKVETDASQRALLVQVLFFILGVAATVLGSRLLVSNGIQIAALWGVPTMVVGLTITSIGTSLPELFSAIVAVRKKAPGLSIGNLLGASILNVLLVVGASAAVRGLAVSPIFFSYHLPALFLMVSGVMLFTLYGDRRYTRLNGGVLLFMYLTYLWIGTLTSAA